MLGRIIYVLIVAAVVLAGGWLLDTLVSEPGTLTLDYNDRIYQLSLFEAALLAVATVVAVLIAISVVRFAYSLVRFIMGDETAFSSFFARSRERRGLDALSKGLLAVAEGDARTALKKAKLAEKYLKRPALTRLLNAQAAELAGDTARAEVYYKALMAEDNTAFVGSQGLLGQAVAENDTDRALQLAVHAHELKPKNAQAMETLYTLQSQKFDWAGARKTVTEQKRHGLLPKPEALRREAALAYAQAEDAERVGEKEHARKLAVEAAKLDPSNVDAVTGAARQLIDAGSKRAASKLIVESWRIGPHPKLAAAFAAIEPDEAPAARRRRFQALFDMHPEHDETQFMKAELALVDEDWTGARRAIEDLRETEPSARSCAVFAAIARGEGEPDHVIQAWLARGLGAPRGSGNDAMISNAAMLPLLMGARDDSGMDDVTEPQDDASAGDTAPEQDPEVEILEPEDRTDDAPAAEGATGTEADDAQKPESEKKPETVS